MFRQLICIIGLAAASLVQAAEAGRIVFVTGDAKIAARTATLGDAVQEGDELATGTDGYVYLKTIDNGFLILRPGSRARIVTYHVDAQNPKNTRIKFELLSGVARAISGKAVKEARENFRFNTPVAAIGVRGTDFTVFTDHEVSRVAVISGGITVSGFAAACRPEGSGPCEGNASRELSAGQVGQLLQIRQGQAAPQLIHGSVVPPEVNAPPRIDEPSGKAPALGTVTPVAVNSDLSLDPKKSDNIKQQVTPVQTQAVPPVVSVPPVAVSPAQPVVVAPRVEPTPTSTPAPAPAPVVVVVTPDPVPVPVATPTPTPPPVVVVAPEPTPVVKPVEQDKPVAVVIKPVEPPVVVVVPVTPDPDPVPVVPVPVPVVPVPVVPVPVVPTPSPVVTPDPPVVIAPIPERPIIWGRWTSLLGKAAAIDAAKLNASAEFIDQNANFALFRSKEGKAYQMPSSGAIAFTLRQSEAYIFDEPSKLTSLAAIENGRLQVDFGNASYATGFDLVSGKSERFAYQSQGAVMRDGTFSQSNRFSPTNNLNLSGVLGAESGASAAYIFSARVDNLRTVTGATYWTK